MNARTRDTLKLCDDIASLSFSYTHTMFDKMKILFNVITYLFFRSVLDFLHTIARVFRLMRSLNILFVSFVSRKTLLLQKFYHQVFEDVELKKREDTHNDNI
jgi:hypothetical protein